MNQRSGPLRRGLLMDYAGVLTGSVAASFARWEARHGVGPGRCYELLLAASAGADGGLIGAIERGEISDARFDAELHRLLTDAGHDVPAGALLDGLFAGMLPDGGLWDVVRHARDAGVRTALVSNSWGFSAYPRERLEAHFDATVISGEVGVRKPDPEIYLLAAERLGLDASACAFVDDLEPNVVVARDLGMFGVVHHGDDARTVAALESFLEVPLPSPASDG